MYVEPDFSYFWYISPYCVRGCTTTSSQKFLIKEKDKHQSKLNQIPKMLSTRVITTGTLSKTLGQFATSGLLVRGTNCVLLQQHRAFSLSSKPFFNSSQRNKVAETEVKNLKEFRERSWPHPVYSEQEMKDIVSICLHYYLLIQCSRA